VVPSRQLVPTTTAISRKMCSQKLMNSVTSTFARTRRPSAKMNPPSGLVPSSTGPTMFKDMNTPPPRQTSTNPSTNLWSLGLTENHQLLAALTSQLELVEWSTTEAGLLLLTRTIRDSTTSTTSFTSSLKLVAISVEPNHLT